MISKNPEQRHEDELSIAVALTLVVTGLAAAAYMLLIHWLSS